MSDEKFATPAADRAPTADEEAAAEAAATDVDVPEVGKHFREAAETGAAVKGEGEIEPSAPADD